MPGSAFKRRRLPPSASSPPARPAPPAPTPTPTPTLTPTEAAAEAAFARGYAAGLAAAAPAPPAPPPLARSAAKGVSWRLFSAAVTLSLISLIFGGAAVEGASVGKFAAAEFCLKLGMYVAHERLWAWLDGRGGSAPKVEESA
jgi:hypothetical protein